MPELKQTLLQHFTELRRRVLWTLLFFAAAFGVGFIIAPHVQDFLLRPLANALPGGTVLYTRLTDGLFIEFSLATLFAMLTTLPFALWHFWTFISPGLLANERRTVRPVLWVSPVLFLLGAAFAYFFLFPIAFKFFIGLNSAGNISSTLMPAMPDYLSFVIGMLKIFGLAFQLPLVLVVLNQIGILPRAAVIRSRRYAVVGIFVLAAILTPPDILSQILLALPMLALFEISILFMKK